MIEQCMTAGFLRLKDSDRQQLETEARGIISSLTLIDKQISIAVTYADPSQQEQAEEFIRELLSKIPGTEGYDIVINSTLGDGSVGSSRKSTSI